MSVLRQRVLAFSLLLSTSLLSYGALAQPASDAQHEGRGGFFRSLSPQQKMMFFFDIRKATAGMTDDQRLAYRLERRERFAAMSDDEKQQYAIRLQSEWDALPADQKNEIRQQAMAWRDRMRNGGDGQQAQ